MGSGYLSCKDRFPCHREGAWPLSLGLPGVTQLRPQLASASGDAYDLEDVSGLSFRYPWMIPPSVDSLKIPSPNSTPAQLWQLTCGVYPDWSETNRHSRLPVAKRREAESCLLCSRSMSLMWHHIKLYRQPLVLNQCTELTVVSSRQHSAQETVEKIL